VFLKYPQIGTSQIDGLSNNKSITSTLDCPAFYPPKTPGVGRCSEATVKRKQLDHWWELWHVENAAALTELKASKGIASMA
jgi:hypothetical protein